MRVEINGSDIRSEADLHRVLSRELDFGPYYGGNLDALWDRLSTDVERPVELVWRDSELSRKNLGEELFGKIRYLLLKVHTIDQQSGRSDRFTVTLE